MKIAIIVFAVLWGIPFHASHAQELASNYNLTGTWVGGPLQNGRELKMILRQQDNKLYGPGTVYFGTTIVAEARIEGNIENTGDITLNAIYKNATTHYKLRYEDGELRGATSNGVSVTFKKMW